MKREFSKTLLIQESALMWIVTIALVALAFYCVSLGFVGTLPWLSAMVGLPWAAYGVSQACYYRKSMAENCEGGVVYCKARAQIEEATSVSFEQFTDTTTTYYNNDYTI